MLRSRGGEGFRMEGDGEEGEKNGKKGAQKVENKGVVVECFRWLVSHCCALKWRRRYTPPLAALQVVATPPSPLFPQIRVCRRGVAATSPKRPCRTPSRTPL